MKKTISVIIVMLLCLMVLAGCGCEHQWLEADCDSPMTCALCEETEGAPAGHSWMAATCEAPKTCENCGETQGEAKGHFWEEATCTQAKSCNVCKQTEGDALGHSWEEATTEAPKTCSLCQLTEGEKLDVDPRFTTAATKEIQGMWTTQVTMTGEMLGMEKYVDELEVIAFLEFCNDGKVKISIEPDDYFAFKELSRKMNEDLLYAEFAAMGIGRNEASALIEETYGMPMEKLIDEMVESLDYEAIFKEFFIEAVYYVEDGNLYLGEMGWEGDFDYGAFTVEGDTLSFEEDILDELEDFQIWTRVKE